MKDIAPVLAGTPPAFILAVQLYKSVAQALGIADVSFWSVFPGLLAAAGMGGMIWVELQTYKTAARAFALRELGPFIVATLGALTLSGFVIFAVYIGAETKSLATSTIGMIIGYLIIAVNEYMHERKIKAEKDKADRHQRTQDEISLIKAQAEAQALIAQAEAEKLRAEKLLTNAEARKAVVSAGQTPLSGGQARTRRTDSLDPIILFAVTDYLRKSPNPASVSLRELEAAKLGVKKSAAADYKAVALEQIKVE
jgi:hypothetical protein